jgi:hypothetical protein
MPLTKQLISEIAADMAAEQAYYKRLHTLIECAKHTGAPIPQVRPFPGRAAVAGACLELQPVPAVPKEPFAAGASGLNGAHPRGGRARRWAWATSRAQAFREAIGRVLHPRPNGPVL